jgi:hypothetical protein
LIENQRQLGIVGVRRSGNSNKYRAGFGLPMGQAERFQRIPSGFSPQPALVAQALVGRHYLQLVHHSRARLHGSVPVPQQLPQIAILPARYPNLRKVIFQLYGPARAPSSDHTDVFGLKCVRRMDVENKSMGRTPDLGDENHAATLL